MDEIRNPYERWMVRSNLERIERGEADPAAVVATLRAGGYERVAAAVEELLEEALEELREEE